MKWYFTARRRSSCPAPAGLSLKRVSAAARVDTVGAALRPVRRGALPALGLRTALNTQKRFLT
jgi:hypothetical protein